ncbi:negative regulator of flagellin synthesis FlgM [Clostridium algifaecis]|uniref:Negative regulator of flagellin synthesis n=1 Tax=Clostridium algifaecis TaxID=1472040 RepID=A0ABS4KWD0_9CLOT|nr:flagellar biosynthesis anti-sigma factor FlgM [Clostridium algifaecis]MBP2033821.1 negative regulator of flagellin synthesis FlgM [Clostridium algifaecis]
MKVNGIKLNNITNIYNESKKGKDINPEKTKDTDSIQISSIGKSLSAYSLDNKFIDSKEKVENIKNAISNGTYKVDAKLVAQKMLSSFI